MPEYPYTTVPGKLKDLLTKIREVGVPSKASQQWLKSIGLKSSNDPTLLTVLRFIGFIDSSGVPTENWRNYRGVQHGQVLANAIRQGYSELFAVYPDAHSRSSSDVEHVFGTSSSAGKQAVAKTVRTFQNLCSMADFTATGVTQRAVAPGAVGPAIGTEPTYPLPHPGTVTGAPSLHIDIQVHISPDATPEQIDRMFESMAKHLYRTKE